ncbi:MAG: acetoacetate decarboxylase family protein [Candidatus Binatia bacterium]|nr:acetoacetate decarboxylase family protein [Candidatus Binatia bacterium]
MPKSGKQDVQSLLSRVPVLQGFDTQPWDLRGAQILPAIFEIAEEPAEFLLPPALHPSIPPYATFSLATFPDSPVGPFALAQVRVVGRAGVRPRGYLLGAYTTTEQAAVALRTRWGFALELGEIAIDQRHDRIIGQVRRGGEVILRLELENPEQISGADVAFLDSLHLVRVQQNDGERPLLIQVDPEYVFHSAQRGRPRLPVFQGAAWGTDGRLRCTNPVSAVFVRCDTDLPKLRFALDPLVEGARGRVQIGTVG